MFMFNGEYVNVRVNKEFFIFNVYPSIRINVRMVEVLCSRPLNTISIGVGQFYSAEDVDIIWLSKEDSLELSLNFI